MPRHHRKNLEEIPLIFEHCESTGEKAIKPDEGYLKKHTSAPINLKQLDPLIYTLSRDPKYKLHQKADSGSPNKKIHSENPLQWQAAKQHEDQNRSRNSTHESRYVNQVRKRDRIAEYYPNHKYWPEDSHFPIHSLVKPEQVPYIGSAREKKQVWNTITARDVKFESYNLPFTTSEDVCYALWNGNNVIIRAGDRCDLILGWHRSEKIFLVIKLFTKKNRPHLEELMYRGTTSLFLSGTHSVPWFYGLIYVGSSPKYVSFGLVNRFIGIDLEPTTFRSLIDNMQESRITQLPDEHQLPILRKAVFMCINLIDQLQKIHDYGAVLNTFSPQTILFEFDKDNNVIPYFTHLTDITYQMDALGGRASDFVLAKLKNSSQCLRQLRSMTADANKNTDSSFGKADDILEIGKIIYAVGRVTDLPTLTWLGESLLRTTPSNRPSIQLVRIQLAQTLINLKQQMDLRNYQRKSDSTNDQEQYVDYFHLAEQYATTFKDSHCVSTCSSNYMGNNPVNLMQPVMDKENYSNDKEYYDEEKSTYHEEKIYSHETYSDEEDNAHYNKVYSDENGTNYTNAYSHEEGGSYCEEKIDKKEIDIYNDGKNFVDESSTEDSDSDYSSDASISSSTLERMEALEIERAIADSLQQT